MLTHKGTRPLKTQRLLLRKIKKSDYRDIYRYASKEEVARYVTWSTHKNIKETKALCKMWAEQCEKIDKYHWTIIFDGKVIGNIEVGRIVDETAGLGWQFDSEYWNRGIMTEAAGTVVNFLFNEVNIAAVEAAHIAENVGSGRVMQKIGMKEIAFDKSVYEKLGRVPENENLKYYRMENHIRQIDISEYHKCSNIWDMEKCPYTEDFKRQIKNGTRLVFVYSQDGEFIGECDLVTENGDPDYTIKGRRAYLSRLIVKKEYRNKGIGTETAEFVINKARRMDYGEISLGVNTDNQSALHIYKKLGFDIIKTDSDENGEFFKMVKNIQTIPNKDFGK